MCTRPLSDHQWVRPGYKAMLTFDNHCTTVTTMIEYVSQCGITPPYMVQLGPKVLEGCPPLIQKQLLAYSILHINNIAYQLHVPPTRETYMGSLFHVKMRSKRSRSHITRSQQLRKRATVIFILYKFQGQCPTVLCPHWVVTPKHAYNSLCFFDQTLALIDLSCNAGNSNII